jgi:hypothetical protein
MIRWPRGRASPGTRTGPPGQPAGPGSPEPGSPAGPGGLGRPADGWRGAGPELVIAVVLLVTAGIVGYVLAGPAGSGVVALGAAVIVLVGFRGMVPPGQPLPDLDHDQERAVSHAPASFTGFWRKRAGLEDGTKSMASYDNGLRLTLQHLLAARLAERHGISLREDPDLARQVLCQGQRDDGLWYWVDPGRPSISSADLPGDQAARQRGIPPRTLARLIDRLERL